MSQDVIEDPIFRYRVRLSRQGEVLRGEFWVDPQGGGTVEHLHPPVEERFEVLEGELTYRAGSGEHKAGPGDRFTIKPGVPHSFQNTGEGIAHAVAEMEPALDMESLFKDAAALGHAGKWTIVGRRGMPRGPRSLLDMAAFLDRYQEIFIATSPPRLIQRVAVPRLARIAHRRRERAGR